MDRLVKVRVAIVTLICIALVLYASEQDYRDHVEAQRVYCEHVAKGRPNYRGLKCQ